LGIHQEDLFPQERKRHLLKRNLLGTGQQLVLVPGRGSVVACSISATHIPHPRLTPYFGWAGPALLCPCVWAEQIPHVNCHITALIVAAMSCWTRPGRCYSKRRPEVVLSSYVPLRMSSCWKEDPRRPGPPPSKRSFISRYLASSAVPIFPDLFNLGLAATSMPPARARNRRASGLVSVAS
jgi:hypothetical protein